LVGVADARQRSRVVCLVLWGDATEDPRVVLAMGTRSALRVVVFVLFPRAGHGGGESTRFNVSIVSAARDEVAMVCARCIGARFLLFVTLGGSSASTGDGDRSRAG
jgi:hypothetical protein